MKVMVREETYRAAHNELDSPSPSNGYTVPDGFLPHASVDAMVNIIERPHDSTLHENPRIRVLVVDDHVMVRQGLRCILESYPDIEVVGEVADGKESLISVERVRSAVVVMDLNMPRMNGIDATAIIKSRYPDIIVLGLSVNVGEDNHAAMIQAGASALLRKEAAVDQLYDMIHEAVATR